MMVATESVRATRSGVAVAAVAVAAAAAECKKPTKPG